MDYLPISTIIILQFAAAALHGYFAYCFFPDTDQKKYRELDNFMWAMIFCALFHFTDALQDLARLSGLVELASVFYILHLVVEYSLCPFMVSNLMAEYTRLPEKPNLLAQILVKISIHARPISYVVLIVAYGSLATRIYYMLNTQGLQGFTGWLLHSDLLVISLAAIWLTMIWSGLRPRSGSYGHKNSPVLWIRIFFVLMILLAVSIDEVYEHYYSGIIETAFVHFVTVPFAILFSWYRYRLVLVDIIAKKPLPCLLFSAPFGLGFILFPPFPSVASRWQLFFLSFATLRFSKRAGMLLDNLWMPALSERATFRKGFPLWLSRCPSSPQAIKKTEQSLSDLFKAKVTIQLLAADKLKSETIDNDSQDKLILIREEPAIAFRLGYIKDRYPWFSEASNIANEAANHLHNHLKLLELQAEKHWQEISNRELETLAARAERDAMRAQIRPHFLFNVLPD